jgi:hypothetical protein
MRTVSTLALTPTDKALTLTCDDRDPESGNMSHDYEINCVLPDVPNIAVKLHFQHGPIAEHGVNGITNEALLSIVRDRLEGAQEGKFRCRENALAITAIEEASLWLAKRTLDRMARGVEGRNEK